MPEIIDSLLVTLGLDASAFKTGSAKARSDLKLTAAEAKKQAKIEADAQKRTAQAYADKMKSVDESTKKTIERLGNLAEVTLGAMAAFTSAKGMIAFGVDATNTNASIGRLSANINVSAEAIGAWEAAVKTAGGSAADLDSSMMAIAQAKANWDIHKDTGFNGIMNLFGISPEDLNDIPGTFLKLAKAKERLHMNNAQFSSQVGQMGISQSVINLLEQGPDKVAALVAQMTGLAPNKQDTGEAADRQGAASTLETTFTSIGNTLLHEVNPQVMGFLQILQGFADWGKKNPALFGAVAAGGGIAGVTVSGKIATSILKKLMGGGSKAAATAEAEAAAAGTGEAAAGAAGVGAGLPLAALLGLILAFKPSTTNKGEDAELQRGGLGYGTAPKLPKDIEAEVRFAAKANGVDPDMMVAQLMQEGGGYSNHSAAGAFGPAQLMPGTARDLGVATSTDDPNYSWETNADAGVRYFSQMLTRYHGDYQRAQVAYNWGPGNADKWDGSLASLPRETQTYLARIAANANLLKAGAKIEPIAAAIIRATRRTVVDAALLSQTAQLTTAAAQYSGASGSVDNSKTHNETHVGGITVHTNAADGAGIAKDIHKQAMNFNLVNQAQTGLA